MLRKGVDAAALVRQHTFIDGVARASSAGTKSGSIARSLVLLTILAPVSRTARLEDQLQLGDEVNSEIADGYTVGSSAHHRTAVGDLPTSSVSAVQLVRANTPRTKASLAAHLTSGQGGDVFWPRHRGIV